MKESLFISIFAPSSPLLPRASHLLPRRLPRLLLDRSSPLPFPLLAVLPAAAAAPPVSSPALATDDPPRQLHRLLLPTAVASDCCCSTSRNSDSLVSSSRDKSLLLWRLTKDSGALVGDSSVAYGHPLRHFTGHTKDSSPSPSPLTTVNSFSSKISASRPPAVSTLPSPASPARRNLPPRRPRWTSPS